MPNLGVGELVPLRVHVEAGDAVTEAGLEAHHDQEGGEDHVGEQRDEVRQLAWDDLLIIYVSFISN